MEYTKLSAKKKELDGCRPLPLALSKNLADWFRIELTYSSNALEGNTLSRRETAQVVEKNLAVGGKSFNEHLEARNHAAAFDWVSAQLERKPKSITESDILHLHSLILKGIDDVYAGRYRNVAVRISGSSVVLPNALKVPTLMMQFIAWLQMNAELHPVALAAEAHYRLVTIHPFVDGNGRTARLLMNMILMMSGYPPAIINPRERLSYIAALEKAQLGGALDDYFKIIMRAVDRSLDIYLKALTNREIAQPPEERLLKIGALAKKVGASNSTIRHWTKAGLLEVAKITPSGYQLYAPEMIERVKKIHALKTKRYTLTEISRELVSQ